MDNPALPPAPPGGVCTSTPAAQTEGVTRAQVFRLQAALAQMPQADLPLKHHFAPGAYAREMFIPKGICVVGKIHRHAHLNIIAQGDVSVATEFGVERLVGPCTFTSQPGTKRAVYANEDTIWTTIHVTDETDLDRIEDQVIAKDYSELPAANSASEIGPSPTLKGIQT